MAFLVQSDIELFNKELLGRNIKEISVKSSDCKICLRTNNKTFIIKPTHEEQDLINLMSIEGDIINILESDIIEVKYLYGRSQIFDDVWELKLTLATEEGSVVFNMLYSKETCEGVPLKLLKFKRGNSK